MEDELQDFEEYIGEWLERADAAIDAKEQELDALIEKRNEAANAIGADSRSGGDDEGDDPRQPPGEDEDG
jgi:hypothetical protein